MSYLYLSFEIVFPIFVFMLIGYFLKLSGLISAEGFQMMNRMVFYLILPLKLFVDIVQSDFKSAFQLGLVTYVVAGVCICFAVLYLIIPKFVKEKENAIVVIQAIYRSNYVLFGISVASNIYGERDLGVVAVLSAFVVPLYNILAVILFEVSRGNTVRFGQIAKGVVKNHFVLAAVLGAVITMLNWQIPSLLFKPLKDMSTMATPLAIICLGASFSFKALKKYARLLAGCCIGRLVVMPALFIGFAVLLGYRDVSLAAVMLLSGSPTAAASYTMARELGGNGELAGMIVAVTSIGAVFSIFLWIVALKYLVLI